MKKLVSLVLIISILASSCLAAGSINADANAEMVEPVNAIGLTAAQMADIAASLQAMEQDKGNFGMEDVNFSSLMLGNEIFTYEYTVRGLEQLDFSYIPVFSGDTIVALVVKNGIGPEAVTKQIGTALATEINEVLKTANAISLIYSADGCYAFDGERMHMLTQRDNPSRATLPRSLDLFAATTLKKLIAPIVCGNVFFPKVQAYTNGSLQLNLTFVYQGNYTNLCWAACLSSLAKYYNTQNSEYTPAQISEAYYGTGHTNESADIMEAKEALSEVFSLSCSCIAQPDDITTSFLMSELLSGNPVYGAFDRQNGGAHAALIYGYNTYGAAFYILDPTDGTIIASYINNYLTYVSVTGGDRLQIDSALYSFEEE